jgi:hypothetical protein
MNKIFQLIIQFLIIFNEMINANAGTPKLQAVPVCTTKFNGDGLNTLACSQQASRSATLSDKKLSPRMIQKPSEFSQSDYIKKAKDSYVDMLNQASIKYKNGEISKLEYSKIVKQVSKMVDYYKNFSAVSGNSLTPSATSNSAVSVSSSNASTNKSFATSHTKSGETDSSLGSCITGNTVTNSLGTQTFSITCTNDENITSTHVAYWNLKKKACGFFDANKFINVSCPLFINMAALPASTQKPAVIINLSINNSTGVDSSKTLQNCFDKTPIGETLFLPKGKYTLVNEVIVRHPMKLTTLDASSAKCSADENHGCAELRANRETFTKVGFFKILSKDVTIDHIVINGNRQERYQSAAADKCKISADNNIYGQNDQFSGDNIKITNSVFKNALCGTGLYLISGSGFNVNNNTITSNGIHDKEFFWSDGLTALEISNSNISDNLFSDNTDVDLILGACPNCTIKSNRITHSNSFASSSFAGIMIQAWPNGGTTGNYTGADISNNNINCSIGQRCGFGLYVGQSAWYEANTYGGNVHDNTIIGAQQGFAIDKVKNFSIANNQVSGSQGTFETSCGKKYFSAFVITPGTIVNRSNDLISNFHYLSFKLDGCIPNDWRHPY